MVSFFILGIGKDSKTAILSQITAPMGANKNPQPLELDCLIGFDTYSRQLYKIDKLILKGLENDETLSFISFEEKEGRVELIAFRLQEDIDKIDLTEDEKEIVSALKELQD